MPFEPRLVHPDDPAWSDAACDDEGELALPPDLALLAEQLTADAVYIAERHTAAARTTSPLPATSEGSWRRGLTAAVVLLAVSAGIARWTSWPTPLQTAGPATVQGDRIRLVNDHRQVTSDRKQPADSPLPAYFFQGLSGPEQEGLLDLLEEESTRQSSLSI